MDWIDDPDSRVRILHTAMTDLKGVARLAAAGPVARFTAVGVLSTLAYALIYVLAHPLLGVAGANLVALVAASLTATVTRYVALRTWVFAHRLRAVRPLVRLAALDEAPRR